MRRFALVLVVASAAAILLVALRALGALGGEPPGLAAFDRGPLAIAGLVVHVVAFWLVMRSDARPAAHRRRREPRRPEQGSG